MVVMMVLTTDKLATGEAAAREARPFDFVERLREISMFFDGTDRVHQAMRTVATVFENNQIAYAVLGGMAVNAHRHERTTGDVNFLVRTEALPTIQDLAARGVFTAVPGRPRRFVDPATGVHFDVLLTGMFPGNGKPGPIAFPDPADVSEVMKDLPVVNLKTLVELKLAARRYQDFADVVNLITSNDLDESYLDQIHASVHRDFIECLEEKRREDEYERRQDEAFGSQ
jgi:hypothetical protein